MCAEINKTVDPDWRLPSGFSTFGPTLWLLPRHLRRDASRLYTALRTIDDLVDEQWPQAEERVQAAERWCLEGTTQSPEARVFADLADRRGLGSNAVAEFCLAMRHDLERASIETEAEFEIYCRRTGGAAGMMFAQLVGASTPEAEQRATDLGMAMQITNIIRDVDDDLASGRTYVSREAIARYGSIEPGKREALLRDQIASADALYDRGIEGVSLLPEGRRWVAASAALYREILRQIERDGYGKHAGRAVVPKWRQRAIIARASIATR